MHQYQSSDQRSSREGVLRRRCSFVIPAQAGIHNGLIPLDSRLRGNDEKSPNDGNSLIRGSLNHR